MHQELADVLIQTLFRHADVSADATQFKTPKNHFAMLVHQKQQMVLCEGVACFATHAS